MTTKNYEPSKKEVLTELMKDTNQFIKPKLKNIGEFIKYYVPSYVVGLVITYAVPTTVRALNRLDEKCAGTPDPFSNAEGLGIMIGFISGYGTAWYTSNLLFNWLSDSPNFFGLLVPISITQTTSSIYEAGRKGFEAIEKKYREKKRELIKNKTNHSEISDVIVVEPNNKLEIAPPQEVNPEDEKARDLIVKSALKLEELAKELKQN